MGSDGTGGPRDTGRFRVPRDMLGMLIDPVGTLRKSKYAPMSGILFWYGALTVINALILGGVSYYVLKMTDFEQTVGPVFWFSVNMVTGEMGIFIVITVLIVAFVHGISRILGRNSTIPMAIRVVLSGATPVFLFSWTFWPGPVFIHSLLGIDLHAAATLVFYANILFLIWAVILIGIGFRELHGMAEIQTSDKSHTEAG